MITVKQIKLNQHLKQLPRRLPHHAAEIDDQEVENMMEKGIVEPSSNPWAAGMVLIEKKDGTKRSS